LSVIAASTSGLNVQKEHKKSLLAKKIGLPLKRLSTGKRVGTSLKTSVWGLSNIHVYIYGMLCKLFWADTNTLHVVFITVGTGVVRVNPEIVCELCISEDDNDIYHVYEHRTDITVATLCDKDPAQNCFLASCLDRECCKWGVFSLRLDSCSFCHCARNWCPANLSSNSLN
jgi:hypothetical protein